MHALRIGTSHRNTPDKERLRLEDGGRIAVIGSGPAGSLFSYFLLQMAGRVGLSVAVDIYEPKTFSLTGPKGCNMCGGIISESLVQNLAAEGINLSTDVVQRGIDSYVLHMDAGTARIDTPLGEMRIGAVHRGAGPINARGVDWTSFDLHLQRLALKQGARLLGTRIEEVTWNDGKPSLKGRDGSLETYDLVVAAAGVNTSTLKLFEGLGIGYERPAITKTMIREYYLGRDVIARTLGSSMHVFLLDIPRLEFAAVIPKGDYATMCLLGNDIDNELIDAFVSSPEVRACMGDGWVPDQKACQCLPYINVRGVAHPYADRFLFIGDCGVTRLYKDGIGAAYRTAKAAATAAVFEGISKDAFRRRYLPVCRKISTDNRIGRVAFMFTELAKHAPLLRRAVLRMVEREQARPGEARRMSGILWDMFSGSAPYADIFARMLNPIFIGRFFWSVGACLVPAGHWRRLKETRP